MNLCKLCRVQPGVVTFKGFPICHGCVGKTVHAIGTVAEHFAGARGGSTRSTSNIGHPRPNRPPIPPHSGSRSGVIPPPTPWMGGDVTGQSTTSQSAITLAIGLGLIAAAVGVFYMYSDSKGSKSPLKFGFGLDKARH